MTAAQAGEVAQQAGARLLVLTHFSQRYQGSGLQRLADEAAAKFSGEIVLASDLTRIPVPRRERPASQSVPAADLPASVRSPTNP